MHDPPMGYRSTPAVNPGLPQRRVDADAAVEPREQIRNRNADFLRRTVRLAGQAHDPAHRLDEAGVTRPWAIGAGLAGTSDRAIDEAGEAILELMIGEPVFS